MGMTMPDKELTTTRTEMQRNGFKMVGSGMDMGVTIKAFTFGHLMDLVDGRVEHYKSDLFHDALWIERNLDEEESRIFWYAVDVMGTSIGTDPGVVHLRNQENLWKIEVKEVDRTWYIKVTHTPWVQNKRAEK